MRAELVRVISAGLKNSLPQYERIVKELQAMFTSSFMAEVVS